MGVALAAYLVLMGLAPAVDAYPRPGATERVSVSSDGRQVEHTDQWPFPVVAHCGTICKGAISANGRFVAFESIGSDLVPDDNNLAADIFVRDLKKNTTERVSISTTGTEGVGFCTPSGFSGDPTRLPGALAGSYEPSISASGRFVVFSSCAQNLVPVDAKHAQDVFVHDRKTGDVELVSASADGTPALCVRGAGCNRSSKGGAISANGRYVTFYSDAPNLVAGDTNGQPDAFVKDLRTGAVELVSVASDGTQAEFGIFRFPVISPDGRYVAVRSTSDNLVPNDVNIADLGDVFVFDRKTDKTELINITRDGRQELTNPLKDLMLFTPGQLALSRDGRFVAFASRWDGFVPNDTNDTFDIFLKDRKTGSIERVSLTSDGREGAAFSEDNMSLSYDGRFVAFWSEARLVPDDDEGGTCKNQFDFSNPCFPPDFDKDVYVYDRYTGAVDLASRSFDGTTEECSYETDPCGFHGSTWPSLDASGRLVAFHSYGDRLVRGDTNESAEGQPMPDNFVRDRGTPLGTGDLVRAGSNKGLEVAGSTAASPSWVRVRDHGNDSGDLGNGSEIIGALVAHRPQFEDIFVRIDVDHMPGPRGGIAGIPAAGNPAVFYGLAFTGDGVPYEVRIGRLGLLSGPGRLFFGLFRCDPSCVPVAELNGGYGTIGESVVAAIPLDLLGLEHDGGTLDDLVAFSAYGSAEMIDMRTVIDKVSF